jgi:murein DD-endopeptidase MepM/ murein hydrolase activator NlpD
MVEGSQKIAPLFQQMATTELFGQANPQEFFNAVQQLNPALLKRLEINEKTAKTLDELDKAVIKLKIDYATTIQHLATDAAPTVLNTLKEVLHLLHDPIDESWQRWFGTVASGTPGPGAGSTLSQVARQTPRGLGQGLLTQYSVMPGMGGPRVGAAADTALDDWMRRNSGAGLGQTQVPQATQDAIAEAVRRGTAQGAQDASKREPGIGGIISGGAAGVWEWMKKNLSPISAAGAATMPGGGAAGAAGAPIGTAAAGMAAANAAAAMTPELFQRDPGLSGQTTTYSAGVPSATPGAYGGGVGGATGGASGGPRRPGGPGGTRGADTGTASVIPELGKTIKEALESTGKAQGINPVAIASMITVEDPSWKPGVTGGASGRYMGLTQVGPDTLKEMGVTPQQYLSMTAEQQIQFYSRWLDHYHFKEKLAAAGIDFSKLDSAQQAAVLQAMQFHPNQRGGSATTPPDWMVQIGKGNWDGAVATTSKQAGFLGGTLGSYRDFFKRQQANTVQARQAAADGTSVPGVGTGAIGQVMPVTGRVTGLVGDPRSSHTHAGIDIAAEEGSAISATEGGRVVRAQTQTGYGLTLDVQRPDGTIDRYAHMSAFGVRVGDTVKTGQYIGAVGHTTGTRTVVGSHLHYEHRQRSDFGFQGIIDPAPELGINRKSLMTRLDPIPHDSAALARKTGTPEKKGSVDIEVKVGGNEDLKTKHVWDDPFFRDYHKDDKQQNVGAQ